VRADVCLAPAWYESFPLYPLEAMACGVAVVTTPKGVEDYAKPDANCLVIPPRDPAAAAAALVRLWSNPQERARLSNAASLDAQRFTWTRSVETMSALLGVS